MTENALISVIVPIYKVEKYLDRCIESIIGQTYKNLEIICVNDGSPDKCPEICDAWAKRDSRIKVIHQKNAGSGQSRNNAMDIAKGKFISFVDSDDYIAPRMFEVLMDAVTDDVDIAECDYCIVTDKNADFSVDFSNPERKKYATHEAMVEHFNGRIFAQVIWNKIYRKNVIEEVRFPKGKMIDDEFWTYRALGNARTLVHVYKKLYAYQQQENSVMHTSFSLKRLQAIEALEGKANYISNTFPDLEFEARKELWYSCLYLGQMSLRYLSKEEQKQAFKVIRTSVNEYPLSRSDVKRLDNQYKLWWLFSKHSIKMTCMVRNLLNIGE